MNRNVDIVRHVYERFNARDIDGVLAVLADDVAWANGMDGGHMHGWDEVRRYWMRQWAIVSPHVEPVEVHTQADGAIVVQVRQVVHDLDGRRLEHQTHGLTDKTVRHVFHLREGKIVHFDIADAAA